MVYHLNIGAVHFERKDYAAVHAACAKALEVGSEHRADFKLVAKAHGRNGKAFAAEERLDEAIEAYDKALTNHRDKVYLNPKKELEARLREAKRLAYIDPAKADEAKARGNAHFKAQDYPAAIIEYSEAIDRNPDDPAFASRVYSNRSACYAKKMAIPDALKDADMCIKMDPEFVKGYLRRAHCLTVMKKYDDAIASYRDALQKSPGNAEAQEGIQKCNGLKYGEQAGMTPEQRAEAASRDPEIQQILSDPVMSTILQQMQKDPSSVGEHLKNPEVREKFEKLMASGIIQMR